VILALVLAALAIARVTRFITTDGLTTPLRRRITRRLNGRPKGQPHWFVELIHCDWCVATWVAAAAVIALHFCGLLEDWRYVALGWLALAGAAGLLLDWARR
jgi:hypothetical protein